MTRIVEPEDETPGALARQVADLRVIAVHHEHRLRWELGNRCPPALGEVLELSVAVELVSKEVSEADRPRPDAARDLRQSGLVDLEESELRVPGGEESGGDPGDEIRTRCVVSEAQAGGEDLGSHRRARRLPVRRRDQRRAKRKALRKPVERIGIERRQQLARHGRASARPGEPRETRSRPRNRDPGRQRDVESHRASVPPSLSPTGRWVVGIPRASDSESHTPKGDKPATAEIYGGTRFLLDITAASRLLRGKGEGHVTR